MTFDTSTDKATGLPPEEVFAVLGDETRLAILRALRDADEPLAFSGVYDRVEQTVTSNFNYHLGKLEGHFVRKTEDGYELRQAGRRVIEAVLSGAVTDAPELEPTQIDMSCPFCDAPTAVSYQEERVDIYCTDCTGLFGRVETISELSAPGEYGSLGHMSLPPAGIQGRSAAETLTAAWLWSQLEFVARGSGLCPRCSALVDQSVTVCDTHEETEDSCNECGRKYAAHFHTRCTNCRNVWHGIAGGVLLSNTDLQAFLTAHGINLVAPETVDRALKTLGNYDEEVVSTDPFEARFTFTADEDALTLTVDEELSVIDVTNHRATESA